MAIETPSDNCLLEFFDLCLDKDEDVDLDSVLANYKEDPYVALVHVCQRRRCIMSASPRRLNLHLHCTRRRPVREMLGVWPAFPIVIWDVADLKLDEDNIVAVLEYHDCVKPQARGFYDITIRKTRASDARVVSGTDKFSNRIALLRANHHQSFSIYSWVVLPHIYVPYFRIGFISSITGSAHICKSPRLSLQANRHQSAQRPARPALRLPNGSSLEHVATSSATDCTSSSSTGGPSECISLKMITALTA